MKNLMMIVLGVVIIAIITCFAYAAGAGAKVVSFSGDVRITPAGETAPVRCKQDMTLKPGDKIKTGRNSYLKITFDEEEGNVVKIKAKSQVMVVLKDKDKLELIDGRLITLLKNLKKGSVFQVRTPGAVCGARGTGWETKIRGNVTDVTVFDGAVYVKGIKKDGTVMKKEYIVKGGYRRRVKKYNSPRKEKKVPRSKIRRLEKEITLSKKAKQILGINEMEDKYSLREKMYEKKLLAISNKLDSRAIARAERIVEISPARMDVIDVQIQMKVDRKADDRRLDRIENRPSSDSTNRLTIKD